MAESTVTAQTREQAQRLRRLRECTGITKPQLAHRLGFGSTQTYDLYERGTSIIRFDRVSDWAEAFDIDPLDFVAVLLGIRSVEDVLGAWSIRAALHGQIPEADIEAFEREHGGKPLADQKSAAEGILRGAAKRRGSAMKDRSA